MSGDGERSRGWAWVCSSFGPGQLAMELDSCLPEACPALVGPRITPGGTATLGTLAQLRGEYFHVCGVQSIMMGSDTHIHTHTEETVW